jgi:hypothetical protein
MRSTACGCSAGIVLKRPGVLQNRVAAQLRSCVPLHGLPSDVLYGRWLPQSFWRTDRGCRGVAVPCSSRAMWSGSRAVGGMERESDAITTRLATSTACSCGSSVSIRSHDVGSCMECLDEWTTPALPASKRRDFWTLIAARRIDRSFRGVAAFSAGFSLPRRGHRREGVRCLGYGNTPVTPQESPLKHASP